MGPIELYITMLSGSASYAASVALVMRSHTAATQPIPQTWTSTLYMSRRGSCEDQPVTPSMLIPLPFPEMTSSSAPWTREEVTDRCGWLAYEVYRRLWALSLSLPQRARGRMDRDASSSPSSLTDMVTEEHASANRSTRREMKATVRSTIPTGTGALILHSHLMGRRSCTGKLWSARQLVEAGTHNVYKVPNYLPWATPFNPDSSPLSPITVPYGNYTVSGKVSGQAQVRFFGETSINRVAVNYNDYSDHKEFVLNGYEDVTVSV